MSTVSLYAASETLLSDMAEVLRLYMGGVTVLPNAPGGDMTIRHTEEIADGVRVVRVTDGERCEESRERITGDAVVDKRLRRRQAKLGVYGLMKRRFGFAPPWGSLTGIRPTRLLYANLNKGMTMDEAVHELQRVFDVSDEKAAVLREIVQVQQALTLPARDEIDLYIGIPFCVSRCAYCSFLSGEVGKGELLAPYVEALEREIAQTIALLEETGLRPRAFYMGGGTPTALPALLLRRVLRAAQPLTARCREITVEAGRPDTIDRDKLQALLDYGVTRISVNPQSLDDNVLRAIGRRHSATDILAAMELATSMGFPHVNMDLIAGLPADTPEGFRKTLDQCIKSGADNITVHTLALKKGSRLTLEGSPIPSAEAVAEMLDYADPTLRAAGFAPYYLYRQKYMSGSFENVGWCISGAEGLYNIYIMEELHSILSLGAGGSTKMVDIRRDDRIDRVFHPKYPTEYIQRQEQVAADLEKFAAFHREMLENLGE